MGHALKTVAALTLFAPAVALAHLEPGAHLHVLDLGHLVVLALVAGAVALSRR